MLGKFGSLLFFRGHSVGLDGARVLGVFPKPRRTKPHSWLMASAGEQLECRQLLTNVNISQLAGSQAEESIAVNPTNPLNLVVLSNGGTGNDEFEAFSMDGGKTWTQAPLDSVDDGVGNSSSDRFDGAVKFDSFGNCHIIYIARTSSGTSAMIYGISTNGGQAFATQTVEPLGSGSDKPWLATGPDATNLNNDVVVITFQDDNGNLVARVASVSGLGQISAFSSKTIYSAAGNGNYGVPAVGPKGEIAITWQDPAGGQSGGHVRYTIDQDGLTNGLSFGSFSTPTNTNLGGFDFIPATPDRSTFASPYLAYDLSNGPNRGRLYLAYADETPDESNNSDIYVRYSDNNGLTWSQRVKVNDDSTPYSQFFQDIAVDPTTGALFVGFYDARNDSGNGAGSDTDGIANTDVEYWGSQSTDGGLTWSANVKISNGSSNQARDVNDPGNDFGDYTGVAFYNGIGYAVWSDNSNSTGDNPEGNTTLDEYFGTVQFNLAPTIALTAPGNVTINENTSSPPLGFTVADDNTLPANLIVTAASSDPALFPNGSIVFGGAGANRTVTLTPTANRSGKATITLTVNDGQLTSSVSFDITVLPLPQPLPIPPGITLTTTPFSDNTSTPIADNSVTTSNVIAVSGLDPYLYDADVTINISHPSSGQLNVVLISPKGTRVTLTSGNGGNFANVFAGTTFDDQIITAPVTDYAFQNNVVAPYVVPEGAMAQLDGEDPNGNWTLEINDTANGGVGTLNGWSLSLTTIPVAPPLQVFSGASALANPVPISDKGTPLLLPLTFNGLDPFTWDVNLSVNINHTNSGDLDIYLISPSGTEILMSSGNGGTNDNVFNNAYFDDQSVNGTPVTDATFNSNVSVGSVIPEAALSGFLGENPNGVWTLEVIDHSQNAQAGAVVSWGLDITTVFVNDPPTIGSIINPGAIFEDSDPVTIGLNSISAGGGESQPLKITATSSNPAIIPDPVVNYISPSSSGSLTFQPAPDASGVVVITVRVEDGGFDQNLATTSDNAFTIKTFTIVVNPVNDPPTVDPVANVITDLGSVNEDFGSLDVTLTGISAGGGENQKLQVTALSSQLQVISSPVISYTQGASTAVMHIKSNPDTNGVVLLTVTVMDAGLDNDLLTLGDNLTTTRVYSLTVVPVNDPPTIAPILDPAPINEDAPQQTILLSNLTAGGQEVQPLRVTATVLNAQGLPDNSVISTAFVNYQPGNTTASLLFRPAPNASGTATISVTVEDGGLDGNLATIGDNLTTTESFLVTVNPVNDPPVFATLGDILLLNEDAAPQLINLTGISAGPNEVQDMSFTVKSSNTALIPVPVIGYTSPADAGTMTLSVAPDQFGASTITLTLMDAGLDGDLSTTDDNQQFTRTLTVIVRAVNKPPTIDVIPDPADLNEGAGLQTINLTGITAGANETQPIKVEAFSDNPALIPSPLVNYTSGDLTGQGTLSFTPAPSQFGTATITVRVTDGGLDGDLNTAADNGITTETFTVTVDQVNTPPSFDLIPDPAPINESSTPEQQTIFINNVSPGANETQPLTFTVFNGAPTKITDPVINYIQGSSTATLTYTPKAGQFGVIPITVTVTDPGQDGDPLTTADNLNYTQVFHVQINAVNFAPTIDNILNPLPIAEDSGPQTIPLTNVSAGSASESNQHLSISAVSDNTTLVTGIVAHTNSSGIPDSLTYTLAPNRSGTAVITVTLTDGGLDNDLTTAFDNSSTVKQFTVVVNPVNDPPSLNIVDKNLNVLSGNYNINENSGPQTLSLQNISSGPFESQPVKISATVVGTGLSLISPPVVSYTSPNSLGTLTFTPLVNKSGTAIINLKVEDGGLDGDLSTTGDNLITVYDLNVNIAAVNQPPTLDTIFDPSPINEGAGSQVVPLSGISAGAGEQQSLLITASSDNPNLISNPTVVYADGATTANLFYTPAAHQSGVAHITVNVDDQHGSVVQRFFTVVVNPVNDPPTIDSLGPPLTIDENSDLHTLDLTGISAGLGEAGQLVKVTVTSNMPGLIPIPSLIYTPDDPTGQITFQPAQDQIGTAVLSVKVMDGGADNDLNTLQDNLTTVVTLTVNVINVPQAPSLSIDTSTAISSSGHPVFIAPSAALQDSDTTNFKHGGIVVQLVDGAQGGDRFVLKAFDSNSDRISATRSGLLKRGKSVIGSVTGGTDGIPFVISFSGSVTRKEVQSIVRNIQFAGQSKNLGLRTVEITVTDDTGNASDPVDRNIALN
ncbi:MAG: hypothetical protein JWM11_754 [Planctomycetaceae bacterium]|nr:hypothetical protein [Planctomycetaceae bacterium]